ncbi:hypothetical protein [Rhizobium grahamii]|uniref:DUF551 domain-containing protein n=2 Tax=Rhizobium grahamii TaxID=1120045 RepID=S3H8A4_9HYPH|nr:hypothetical protein [Rhizobium grahamii]EPE94849.1 hypothetical protein RGCCGE502_30123 [Rhizobium grahamii CCGE 502]RDJ05634.1 hypothetical protein B5K06_24585 [Rhizobium grahamii]
MELKWQTISDRSKVKDGRQIIIGAQDEAGFHYNVVFYHQPLEVWYGGPGIKVRDEDIERWAEIPAPE